MNCCTSVNNSDMPTVRNDAVMNDKLKADLSSDS
jgi:hypothetical protein